METASTTFPRFSPSITSFILFILAASIIPASYSDEADHQAFVECNATFDCGALKNLKYPFLREGRPEYCGRPALKLDCLDLNQEEDAYPYILNVPFKVISINRTLHNLTISISVADFLDSSHPEHSIKTNGKDHYCLVPDYCKRPSMHRVCRPEYSTAHSSDCTPWDQPDIWNCDMVERKRDEDGNETKSCSCPCIKDVPVNFTNAFGKPQSGFVFEYDRQDFLRCLDCERSGGSCGTKDTSDHHGFVCLVPDPNQARSGIRVKHGSRPSLMQRLLIVVGVVLFLGIVMFIAVFIYHRRKEKKYSNSSVVSRNTVLSSAICCYNWKPWKHSSFLRRNSHCSIEAFVREYQALASKRYNYSDIRKMTNSFKDKLGQGGYGSVYKGKLPDGRLVAVKVLNSAKGNGEEFINEVASISRTSHVNVVALLGFCFDGSKRALIYEFMLNGSLEKFIRNDNSSVSDHRLGIELLYQIAIGIAQGLGYLHRGCSTRILHFNIKPHNILLDEDFIPKISDFGLAKLCPSKESIVSMGVARGTIGYIAPEVFSRNFGGVSHKSDVYSYGMMILEMVGGKRNTNADLSHSSDVYFPHWVYKRLELGEDIAFHSSMTIKENEIVKRMVLVGLWCIQTDPSLRPSMSKVLEMLEGTVETLLIPPKPFLSSAASLSATNSFTTSDVEIQL